MDTFRYLPGVSTLKLDKESCIGCGVCQIVCPHNVFTVDNKKAEIIDLDGCMECGACAKNCPVNAIAVAPGVGCASYIIKTWTKGKKSGFLNSDTSCC